MSQRIWRTQAARLVRAAIACVAGASMTGLTMTAGIVAIWFIPSTPCSLMFRDVVNQMLQSEEVLLQYLLEPQRQGEYMACLLWEDLTAFPLGVIAGSLIAGAMGRKSIVVTALAGPVAAVLLMVLLLSAMTSPGRVARLVLLALMAWVGSMWLLRRLGPRAAGDLTEPQQL